MNSGLSVEEANELLDQATTKEDIRAIVKRLSVGSDDAVSVLFSGAHDISGETGKGHVGSIDLAHTLASQADGLRVMGETDLGRFLVTDEGLPNTNYKLVEALERVFDGDIQAINTFLYGRYENGVLVEPGLWDDASARFVAGARGHVLTFTGNAKIDRIFARTELPILLENTNVKTIDGISREQLAALPRSNGVPVEAFEAIRTMSALRTAGLGIVFNGEGQDGVDGPRIKIDAREFLAGLEGVTHETIDPDQRFQTLGDLLDLEAVKTHTHGLQVLKKLQVDLGTVLDQPLAVRTSGLLLGTLQRLGIITDAVDILRLGIVGWEAKKYYDQGDREKGDSLLSKWALENGGALLGGRIGAALGFALVGGATGGLGLAVGLGLGLLGAHLGSTYGDDLFAHLVNGLAELHDQTLSRLQRLFRATEDHISPIILDLDGNGVETLAFNRGSIHFDHDDNSFAERTGWVGPRDGLLVRDLNEDGRIDSGKELFGNHTQLPNGQQASHGFEALATLDQDRNGVLDSKDSAWNNLAVWIDANSSATVDQGELRSLASLGIEALALQFKDENRVDAQGNVHRQTALYNHNSGSQYAMHDVWFATDHARSRSRLKKTDVPWLDKIPNLVGSGVVQDLREVVASDHSGRLILLLTQWVKAADQDRSRLLDEIILAWTGVTGIEGLGTGTLDTMQQRKLIALERLLGQPFRRGSEYRNLSSTGMALVDQAFEELNRSLSVWLVAQTDLPIMLLTTKISTSPTTPRTGQEMEGLVGWLERCFDLQQDGQRLRDIRSAMKFLPDHGMAISDSLRRVWWKDLNQVYLSFHLISDSPLSIGTAVSEPIVGTNDDDLLDGGEGDDHLMSHAGHDVLIGGLGNDRITSGTGNDVFLFRRGDGHDRISEWDQDPANQDTAQWIGLHASDVSDVQRHGQDLQLSFRSGDSLTVADYFRSVEYQVEQFRFDDGQIWRHRELVERITIGGASAGNDQFGGYDDIPNRLDGLGGHDILIGGVLSDSLLGSHGNDTVHGRAGNDWLEGGGGDDQLKGESGQDILIGGTGNDWLDGGEGDDIYRLRRGDGHDRISNWDLNPADQDSVEWIDLNASDVSGVLRHGQDIQLTFNSGDSLTMAEYFNSTAYQLEHFRFADGELWRHDELVERLTIGGASAGNDQFGGYDDIPNRLDGLEGHDILIGGVLIDRLLGNHGNDTVHGRAGDDWLEGGSGDDQLKGEAGQDILIGDTGNDWLDGGEGDDVYRLRRGDGHDRISDWDLNPANQDSVEWIDLNASDVSGVLRHGQDIQLTFNSGDSLTVAEYFNSTAYQLEHFRFADGQLWRHDELLERLTIGGASAGNDQFGGYDDIPNRLDGLEGHDILIGGVLIDRLLGNHGNDTVHGRAGDDWLEGGSGDDQLKGEAGQDILIGDTGNDWLDGGEGDDVYRLRRGDGHDRISDWDLNPANQDTVQWIDLNASDVGSVLRHGQDLKLIFSSGDSLTASQYFKSPGHQLEHFRFADGQAWRHGELVERITIVGTTAGNDQFGGYDDIPNRLDGLEGHDSLTGGVLNDSLWGNHGNDTVHGRAGDDWLEGGSGDDQLKGEAGQDILIGGTGNDWLDGGEGNDVYRLRRGDGHDRISDWDLNPANQDTVQWIDLNTSDVSGVLRHGQDLKLIFTSGDSLTASQYFQSAEHQLEQFRFADGQVWRRGELVERITIGGATAGNDQFWGYNDTPNRLDGLEGNDSLTGGILNDALRGSLGNDTIHGRAGDDWLEGGSGDDQLKGEAGQDTLVGGAGHDWIDGGEGDDQLHGEAGNDTLIGGAGHDLLMGGLGADLYRLVRGDGQDRIRDVDSTPSTIDEVVFSDQGTSQVSGVLRINNDLQLTMTSGDSLTINEYFTGIPNRIERFRFADGQLWSHNQLLDRCIVGGATDGNDNLGGFNDMPNRIDGLDGHDLLIGGALNDALRGNKGNDSLQGGAGDDLLEGGFGDDQLLGDAGKDTLIGGTGHDLLDGGIGADVYRIARGDGQKRIRETDPSTSNTDQVQFSELRTSHVTGVLRRTNDLHLTFNSGDSLTVLGYFSSTANRIEQFRFADSRTWTHADLMARLTTAL